MFEMEKKIENQNGLKRIFYILKDFQYFLMKIPIDGPS